MKVLWFNVTEPIRYNHNNSFVGGWQDSLESIVSQCEDIELSIAFTSLHSKLIKTNNHVKYIPIHLSFSPLDKIRNKISWKTEAQKVISSAKEIINSIKPDIIHIFGTEWPFGLISKHTEIPVVIHIQGSIVEYNKYLYPPHYSLLDELCETKFHIRSFIEKLFQPLMNKSRCIMEKEIWRLNQFYMGRTQWDFQLSNTMHPGRYYFHVDEALRKPFVNAQQNWHWDDAKKTILFSTGCSTFWKAPNILLKTAQILKKKKFNFEWFIAGYMPDYLKNVVERKEKTSFSENNIFFLGWQTAEQIKDRLASSTLYIHNAYIENSPNSICEAQITGTPVISANVGGIPSLIEDGKTGLLVPAGEPELMANKIRTSANDKLLLCKLSKNAQTVAMQRHNEKQILSQLLNCYKSILNRR